MRVKNNHYYSLTSRPWEERLIIYAYFRRKILEGKFGSFSFRVGNRGPESSGAGNPPLADWLLILYRINGQASISMGAIFLCVPQPLFSFLMVSHGR
jgi:hypothetical protein